jgi:hypothetical protein
MTSAALRFVRGLEARARTRMAWPRALSAAAIAEPRKPLAPVTRMVEEGAEWNALRVAAASSARPADPGSCETTPCPLSRSISKTYHGQAKSQGSRQYFMMNCRLGQTARAPARNFYIPHGQSSKFSFTRGKPMSFPPIGVKRVRLIETVKAGGLMTAETLQLPPPTILARTALPITI